jgi:hypothetical protein
MAVLSAALLIGCMVAACAAWRQATLTATPCIFIERCCNPALSTGGN